MRYFSTFEGLKKSSELSVRFNANSSTSHPKKSKPNNCSPSLTSFSTQSNSNSSVSSPSYNHSSSLSPTSLSTTSQINDKNIENIDEMNDESTDAEEEQTILQNNNENKQINGSFNQISNSSHRELKKPKYVVSFSPIISKFFSSNN